MQKNIIKILLLSLFLLCFPTPKCQAVPVPGLAGGFGAANIAIGSIFIGIAGAVGVITFVGYKIIRRCKRCKNRKKKVKTRKRRRCSPSLLSKINI